MNCYYSNLIEGHDTHPIDIERALKERLQRRIRRSATSSSRPGRTSPSSNGSTRAALTGRAVAADSIREIHRRFCELLPERSAVGRRPGDEGTHPDRPRRACAHRDVEGRPARRRSVPAPCRAFWSASRRSMAVSAEPRPSSRRRRRITACCGFTRSSTATGASRG